jgi:hypothetical protein
MPHKSTHKSSSSKKVPGMGTGKAAEKPSRIAKFGVLLGIPTKEKSHKSGSLGQGDGHRPSHSGSGARQQSSNHGPAASGRSHYPSGSHGPSSGARSSMAVRPFGGSRSSGHRQSSSMAPSGGSRGQPTPFGVMVSSGSHGQSSGPHPSMAMVPFGGSCTQAYTNPMGYPSGSRGQSTASSAAVPSGHSGRPTGAVTRPSGGGREVTFEYEYSHVRVTHYER